MLNLIVPTRPLPGYLFLALSLTPLQGSPQGQSVIESNVTRQGAGSSRCSVSRVTLSSARFARVPSFEDLIQFFKSTTFGLHEKQVNKAKLKKIPKDEEDVAA